MHEIFIDFFYLFVNYLLYKNVKNNYKFPLHVLRAQSDVLKAIILSDQLKPTGKFILQW